jgi:hypothetical protein
MAEWQKDGVILKTGRIAGPRNRRRQEFKIDEFRIDELKIVT